MLTPFGFISVFILTALLKVEITVSFSGLDCQFIQGHWREFSIRNCTVWPILFFWMFSLLLNESAFIFHLMYHYYPSFKWLVCTSFVFFSSALKVPFLSFPLDARNWLFLWTLLALHNQLSWSTASPTVWLELRLK